MPEVKRFVKSGCGTSKTSKACDIYPELYIKFKGGAKPHIFYPDPDGGEEKKVSIQDWKTDEIHNWFESRDFKRVEPPPKTEEQIAAENAEEERKKKRREKKRNKPNLDGPDLPFRDGKLGPDILETFKKSMSPDQLAEFEKNIAEAKARKAAEDGKKEGEGEGEGVPGEDVPDPADKAERVEKAEL